MTHTTKILAAAALAIFTGTAIYAGPHHPHHGGNDGVRLATDIVRLVGASLNLVAPPPPIVVAPPPPPVVLPPPLPVVLPPPFILPPPPVILPPPPPVEVTPPPPPPQPRRIYRGAPQPHYCPPRGQRHHHHHGGGRRGGGHRR